MKRFEGWLFKNVLWVLFILFFVTIGSSMRYVGEWEDFFVTLGGHIVFGQAVYCYVSRKIIVVGAAIGPEAPLVERRAAGIFALIGFALMWFYAA